jgi:HlyD family secretion protein
VQDLLAAAPGWMIRWGGTVVLAIILGLLVLAWIIRYPDIVTGQALLTTPQEPAYVYAKTGGNIRRLYVRDNQLVREGQLLAEVSSTVQKPQIDVLHQQLRRVEAFLARPAGTLSLSVGPESFGDVQASYNRLVEYVNNLNQLHTSYYASTVARLEHNLRKYSELDVIYHQKLLIARRELTNAELRQAAQRRLFEEKAIAQLDLLEKESLYNQKRNEVESMRQAIVQNQLALTEQRKQLAELQFNQREAIRKLRASIRFEAKVIEAYIHNWRLSNAVTAPARGKVVFLEQFSEGFYAKTDKPFLAIVPADHRIIAKVKVPSARYGKIAAGQKVRLTIDNYPYQEYGFVFGRVRRKSYIPVEKNYELLVELPPNMRTSYGRSIEYKPSMTATADVIVEDQRLLEKLFYSIRQLLRR